MERTSVSWGGANGRGTGLLEGDYWGSALINVKYIIRVGVQRSQGGLLWYLVVIDFK